MNAVHLANNTSVEAGQAGLQLTWRDGSPPRLL